MGSSFNDSQHPSDEDVDEQVRAAFAAWDDCHEAIRNLRKEYDAAMQLYERRDAGDPAELRARIKGLQVDCDQLFFRMLKAAEIRTRERYI